jgi:DNA-binding transcriptional ArsR family regulator
MRYNSLLSSASKVAQTLKAMGNDHRLKILCHLSEGERTVTELCDLIGISQSALSQHLAKLRLDHLVRNRRQAQNIYYSIASEDILEILSTLQSCLKGKTAAALYGNGQLTPNEKATA